MKNIPLLSVLTASDQWRSVRLVSILALILLVIVGIVTVPHLAGATDQETVLQNSALIVDPSIGSAGTVFTFTAGGFQSHETVTFWANDPQAIVHSSENPAVQADSAGYATWLWTAPDGALNGQWSMVADGSASQMQQVIFFEIANSTAVETDESTAVDEPLQDAPATETYVDPAAGTPGTVFTFYAAGFQRDERVSYWVNDPNTRVYTENNYSVNADDGTVSWSWTAPIDAMNGQWAMVAEGVESQIQHIILFEISGGAVVPTTDPAVDEAPEGTDEPAPETPAATDEPVAETPVASDPIVEPVVGNPGTTFTFYAHGFNPREAVHFWANDPSTHVYAPKDDSSNADRDGSVSWTWTAPRTAPGGQWAMVAEGVQSQVQYVILFTIERGADAPDANGTLTANPEAGVPGTTFTFYADGFNSREGVNFWVNDPQARIHTGDGFSLTADENGQAVWSWEAPSYAMTGQWSMVAEGIHSQLQHVILFQITDAPVQTNPDGLTVPENPPGFSVQPGSGNTGNELTFSASGFQFRETVSYWANDPNGLVYGDPKFTTRSGSDGTAEWTWQIPQNARPGVWGMVARGAVSGVEYVIYFGVE